MVEKSLVETEIALQTQLKQLFLDLKDGLIKGELNGDLIDQIELLGEKIRTNREKLASAPISIEDKNKINSLVVENQALFRAVSDLLRFNADLVELLKDLAQDKSFDTYRVVGGKIEVE
jgi:hypothetical protein